jgi:ribonuclease HI
VTSKPRELNIWVDGASRGNPGPSAAGVVLKSPDNQSLKTLSIALGTTTNNIAEYCAILLGMQEAALVGAQKIQIYTDSELVARQWSGQYKVKDANLKIFFRLAKHLATHFAEINVQHVPREENKEADEQANLALDSGGIFS